ncbi:MAG: family 16 glycoside hydrolase [Pyrinomonadaceae bacterium]
MTYRTGILISLMLMLAPAGLLLAVGAQDQKQSWNFDGERAGKIAVGFTGEVGEWKNVADGSAPSKANVLAQLAKNERPVFNVALASESSYANVDITVKFKAIAGVIDQGGGLVWRARDAKNYYIARYNPLENNYRVYKVEDGRRTQLGTSDIKASEGWHTLRVTMTGDHIECFYDGKSYLNVNDSTFRESGKIGLWTKADAQTHFDDLTVSGR